MHPLYNDGQSGGAVQRTFDWSDVEPAVAVLETITELKDGDTVDSATVLEPPLQTHIDIDSLNTTVRSEAVSSITLNIADYQIHIYDDTVAATPAESESNA
jgi:hypothetical protein